MLKFGFMPFTPSHIGHEKFIMRLKYLAHLEAAISGFDINDTPSGPQPPNSSDQVRVPVQNMRMILCFYCTLLYQKITVSNMTFINSVSISQVTSCK